MASDLSHHLDAGCGLVGTEKSLPGNFLLRILFKMQPTLLQNPRMALSHDMASEVDFPILITSRKAKTFVLDTYGLAVATAKGIII